MKALFFLIIPTILGTFFINNNHAFKRENIIISNIEVLSTPETGVPIRSCQMDANVEADPGAASKYTICDSQTTNSMSYKCGSDKQGNLKNEIATQYKCLD